MKTCQPCGAVASADAPHCARCGEASWMPALVFADVVAIAETLIAANPEPVREMPPNAEPPAVLAPEAPTAPLVPRRKRGPNQ